MTSGMTLHRNVIDQETETRLYKFLMEQKWMPLTEKKLLDGKTNQIIINEYIPGQGITAHTDHIKWFGEQISSLTLNSGCNMIFSKAGTESQTVYLDPKSMIILTGPSRWEYTHAIAAVKKDKVGTRVIPRHTRISVTFRQVINR